MCTASFAQFTCDIYVRSRVASFLLCVCVCACVPPGRVVQADVDEDGAGTRRCRVTTNSNLSAAILVTNLYVERKKIVMSGYPTHSHTHKHTGVQTLPEAGAKNSELGRAIKM